MPTNPEHDTRCTHCHRLLFDNELDRWACKPCEDRAAKQIREIPGLYQQLGDALTPGANAPSNTGKISTSRAAPLPVGLSPLNLRATGGISTALQAIEDDWRAALGWTTGPRTDGIRIFATWRNKTPGAAVNEHATFIGNNLLWACASYGEIGYDLDVINTLYWQAKHALSGTRPRIIWVRCRAVHDDGTECGERLPVDINRAFAKCQTCDTRWGREEWVGLYEEVSRDAA